jgi:hypothetical protein
MSFMDVMGGPLGSVNQGFQNNLAQNAAAMGQQQQFFNGLQDVGAQNQAVTNNLYGPEGFGGATARNAYEGAAAGRATGGFGGLGGNNDPFTPVENRGFPSGNVQRGPDLPDISQPWQNIVNQPSPWAGLGFDPVRYLNAPGNEDIKASGVDPWGHASHFGYTENRNGIGWNPYSYLTANPDVKDAGADPWQHAQAFGFAEHRPGLEGLSPLNSYQGTGYDAFDPNTFGMGFPSPGTLGQQPFAEGGVQDSWQDLWNERGPYNRSPRSDSGGDPSRGLIADYYAGNIDVFNAAKRSGQDPYTFGMNHIMAFGNDEGRGYFDRVKYARDNPDVVAAGMDPTAHWFQFGSKEKRAAPISSAFNGETYKLLNPDVAASGMNPTEHWLKFGQGENRMGGAFESAQSYDDFAGTTYREPWIAAIPEARRTAENVNTVKALSERYGWDPAAMAAMVGLESNWDPRNATGSYRGMTQMGPRTFAEAGGRLGGLTWEQYQRATPAQQLNAYGAWIDHYARSPSNEAASLVKGGIGTLPVEDQAAIMQATQFAPSGRYNGVSWVQGLGEGNMSLPTTAPGSQGTLLGDTSINTIRDVMARRIAAWPQNQSPWPLR